VRFWGVFEDTLAVMMRQTKSDVEIDPYICILCKSKGKPVYYNLQKLYKVSMPTGQNLVMGCTYDAKK
jgi:hypothetical protein